MSSAQNVITKKMMLVIVLCLTQSLVTHSILNKCHVHVINGFSHGEFLEAHCRSKDDDLGVRHVAPYNEFNWTFRTNFFSTTKFSCHMWWTGGEKYLDVFWTDDKFLDNECGGNNCRWRSQDDGVYLFSYKHKEYRLKYSWDPWNKTKNLSYLDKKMLS
ncbi:hypothetical protein ERO13_A08G046400v2 [Gossypium hirsutum]|uniref:S-protein homolog n=5 Tax=Gossypium TaxID=3633 RepID=A0A1U8P4H0_GOSHI|nr:S-protein homolog 1 [Gossypium hirsutum]XP_017624774.1 S-protein homolog 1-like [Gossypium arboreum]KAG4186480.1 hypothetical protein ERO13_A08G046400v2 [Gossypium hirsutum]TYI13428.1 hypothetical protein ES332_A08G058100v1 [Gossypium tomentosum]TYJ21314.1 hypothetical protein E1A91_A08G056600v1 [Gossypium mustelinum]